VRRPQAGDVVAQIVVGRIEWRQIERVDAHRAARPETNVLTADVVTQRTIFLLRFGVDATGTATLLGGTGAVAGTPHLRRRLLGECREMAEAECIDERVESSTYSSAEDSTSGRPPSEPQP
jgi:hypothetical protein